MGLTPEAANFAKDFKNLRLIDVKIAYRVAYRRAVAEGMGVTEIEKKDKKANNKLLQNIKQGWGYYKSQVYMITYF
jgi:chromosome partitioning protein